MLIGGIDWQVGDQVKVKSAGDITSAKIISKAGSGLDVNGALKWANAIGEISYISPVYFDIYVNFAPGQGFGMDSSWLDWVSNTVTTNNTVAQIPPTSTWVKPTKQPILYKKGDRVIIRGNIDTTKSYSKYYHDTQQNAAKGLAIFSGFVATVEHDVLGLPVNTYSDLVLKINGTIYYADNFWVGPYIVSQATNTNPNVPVINLEIEQQKFSPKVTVNSVVNYGCCDACGGMLGKHRIGCPPSSLKRNKSF